MNLQNVKRMTQTSLTTKLTFGKYKGCTVKDISSFDGEYLVFLYDNNLIEPDDELLAQLHKTLEERSTSYDGLTWEDIFQ